MRPAVSVVGAAAIGDFVFKVNHLPDKGETVFVEERFPILYGGCAPNIAVGLAQLGKLRPVLIYPVGARDATTSGFMAQMENLGVKAQYVEVPDAESGYAWMYMQPDGSTMCFSEPGAAGKAEFNQSLNLEEWVIVSPVLNKFTIGAAERAGSLGCKLVFNGIASLGLLDYLDTCSILFVNEYEFNQILRLSDMSSLEEFTERYPGMILSITQGKSGSMVWDGRQLYKIPALRGRLKLDVTGAGDAYISGFLSAYLTGSGVEESAYYGAANASLILEGRGGQCYHHSWDDLSLRINER